MMLSDRDHLSAYANHRSAAVGLAGHWPLDTFQLGFQATDLVLSEVMHAGGWGHEFQMGVYAALQVTQEKEQGEEVIPEAANTR